MATSALGYHVHVVGTGEIPFVPTLLSYTDQASVYFRLYKRLDTGAILTIGRGPL
jgi:hypothetical protein